MRVKTWKVTIEACGISQREAADQVEKLLIMMLESKHTRGYTRGDSRGNAVGNWEEGPEVEGGITPNAQAHRLPTGGGDRKEI
jgi:hypothetical protein